MNIKIKQALVSLLSKEDIVSSWGITNISIEETSIRFNVEGLIYVGSICIRYNQPSYEIAFDDGRLIKCSLNELANVLDACIERTENYIRDLEKWFLTK